MLVIESVECLLSWLVLGLLGESSLLLVLGSLGAVGGSSFLEGGA